MALEDSYFKSISGRLPEIGRKKRGMIDEKRTQQAHGVVMTSV